MNISSCKIRNFRKLMCCDIDFSSENTIFVGANNSGKTSAMDALIKFLSKEGAKKINTTDVTLCNWQPINELGSQWAENGECELDIKVWHEWLPSLDVWINVNTSEIHHVSHLIPNLDWGGGELGVRMQLEPTDQKNLEELYSDFRKAQNAAKVATDVVHKKEKGSKFSLWPKSMREFLDVKLNEYFSIKYYLLDPSNPAEIPENSYPLERRPFDELFRIHVINAQRGFSDNSSEEPNKHKHKLAEQLRAYYDKHLDPSDMPDADDVAALKAIHDAQTTFDGKLKQSFTPALSDLNEMNYPGFLNPEIILTSQLKPVDALTHKSGIQFSIPNETGSGLDPDLMRLPENYNGLGYQNLISMLFQLVRFRDDWMRAGKASKSDSPIEPLQLVLIEEPEAHLHAQAQQVFIKKAYAILRKKIPDNLSTQLVVSTHSSHIAYETDFTSLRYFKRMTPSKKLSVPCAEVVNLSTVFGKNETLEFAKRYIKTTHCDLFFADAAILVEGQAERMLVPHFIQNNYPNLNKSYATILEIGGSHAHRLKPLIDALGIFTLIISDLDSIEKDAPTKVRPEREKKYRSGNDTLNKWHPLKSDQDELLDLPSVDKITENGLVRVAYQCPFHVEFNGKKEAAIPYTFEDALALSNLKLFKEHANEATGMLKNMCEAAANTDFTAACAQMFDALKGVKAKMALDVLFNIDPEDLTVPQYVDEGLQWLEKQFSRNIEPVTTHKQRGKK